MDPEHTFLRVHARVSGTLSQFLGPRVRLMLEYACLAAAGALFCLLVVMHTNFVQQPGCSREFSGLEFTEAQVVQIKITGGGLWTQNSAETERVSFLKGILTQTSKGPEMNENDITILSPKFWSNLLCSGATKSKLICKFWKDDKELFEPQVGKGPDTSISNSTLCDLSMKSEAKDMQIGKPVSVGGSLVEAKSRFYSKWKMPVVSFWISASQYSSYALKLWVRTNFHCHAFSLLFLVNNYFLGRQDFVHYAQKLINVTQNLFFKLNDFCSPINHVQKVASGRVSLCQRRYLMKHLGWNAFLNVPKSFRPFQFDHLKAFIVQWLEKRSKAQEPTYLYTVEKGYFLLPEGAKSQHHIRTTNVTISAQNSCFGNRWQQLLINAFVGYDTILINSLLNSRGHGYLYNFQTKEFYNLRYGQEPSVGHARFGDFFVTKSSVLIMSLFVFFTTTMSVSFILRETQSRMLKFTVQLQHYASNQLPTFQLIFVHIIESLIFVPIMVGILFFLFEFYDDQLLAFLVFILVWFCELFTMISVRTAISAQFFPRFFLLYFLVFHIYFFSYAYGFLYLAFSATAAFMQHLVLYFWNRFEVPAVQRFIRARAQLHHQTSVQITSSTLYHPSTFHVTELTMPNPDLIHNESMPSPDSPTRSIPVGLSDPTERPEPRQASDLSSQQTGTTSGSSSINSFRYLLSWIAGGASDNLVSFSIFRNFRLRG
ncbi:tumor-associated protein [Musa troglodytarum]|uniref:Tumor-associated protein n=1 Tax=Musa troglodytarum TaxID=320322 RepID=A0A9E7JDS8_9LILI|nr:tumor-associated protein [Musa troglodytarum]